jgi:hypothetical protein
VFPHLRALFRRDFAIPVIGRSGALGQIEDVFAVATLLLYRGAQIASGYPPYQHDGWWPFASKAVSCICPDSLAFETAFIVAQIAIVTGFLVLYSKHMHIFTAPVNVMLKRQPRRSARSGRPPTSRR